MKTALLVYEVPQGERLNELRNAAGGADCEVVVVGLDCEFALEALRVPFRSAKELRTLEPSESLRLAKTLGAGILEQQTLPFLVHRGIGLARIFTPSLQYYLMRFLYHFDIAISLVEAGYGTLVLFAPGNEGEPPAGAPLERFSSRTFHDAITLAAAKRGIPVISVAPPASPASGLERHRFAFVRSLFGSAVGVLNALISLLPPKPVRILASEYWRNIAPLMRALPDAELALVDRSECRAAGIASILRHRMRFVHADAFVSGSERRDAKASACRMQDAWEAAKAARPAYRDAAFRGYPLIAALAPVMDRILAETEHAMLAIDGSFRMLKRLGITLVLVRASISAQTHFAILCEVARAFGIPSIEEQHGVFSMGDETLTEDHAAEFIAEFGPHERELWKRYGYASRSTALDTGSPRFDVYASDAARAAPPDDGVFDILLIASIMTAGSWTDTYDGYEFLRNTAEAARAIPNAHVTIKLRAGTNQNDVFHEAIRRAFDGVAHTVVQRESLVSLFPKADVVVSCHSTTVHEALAAHKPIVLDATLPIYRKLVPLDFAAHIAAGAFAAVQSREELAAELARLAADPSARAARSGKAASFIERAYLFSDGESSARLAGEIRRLHKGASI